jgi:hypothetical protein
MKWRRFVPVIVVVCSCRGVLGIEELGVDGGTSGEAGTDVDAGGDAPGDDAADARANDADATAQAYECVDAADPQRIDCLLCCAQPDHHTTAVYGAERACACDAAAGNCGSVCPTFCPSGNFDVAACTICAANNLLDGGACQSVGINYPDFVRCISRCPP